MRQVGDPLADSTVAALFDQGSVQAVNQLMRALVDNDQVPAGSLPPVVRDYLAASAGLPAWADPSKIAAGEHLFWRHGPLMIAVLHCYSLPFCYAGRKGVQVLSLTGRLYTNPTRRVTETAQLAVDVMRLGGLSADGKGVRTTEKVRLMHAGVRHLIGHHAAWRPELDLPINQEDMAGTLISFSWAAIDGLRRLGVDVSDAEADAYLHCWNVVGHILGLRPELMCHTMADAQALARAVQRRQYAPCDEGKQMTAALVQMMQHELPGTAFDKVPVLLMRWLFGDANADLLGVEPLNHSLLLRQIVEALNLVTSVHLHASTDLGRLAELFGRQLVGALLSVLRGGTRVQFDIPTELRQAWGIN
jgi:ER-bound oxygenase mpaB/B'/Rubber oxygenase, catalytic domain